MNRIEVTRAQYDSFVGKNNNTLYIISDELGTIYKGATLINKTWPELSLPSELCFTANTAGSTIELIAVRALPSIANTAYSYDGVGWTQFTPSIIEGANVITLPKIGDKVYFRNTMTNNLSIGYLLFKMTGSISASGNINSMYHATNFAGITTLTYTSCFQYLFENCKSLITPPQLPATTLSNYCYSNMFRGCQSLVIPPALPATTLADYCYSAMFYNCGELIVPPALPATTLVSGCYTNMFSGCATLLVNSSPVSGVAEQAWNIPTSGTFDTTLTIYYTFNNCAGTRPGGNDLVATEGQSCTYYTQNRPIS